MKMGVSKKNQKGFTLIEVMVALGIAGALIALAVPQYCRYASISKQAQAKLILSSIWVAEQSFSIQSGSYTACLQDIGVNPTVAAPQDYYGFGYNPFKITSAGCGPGLHNQSCQLSSFAGAGVPCAGSTAFTAASNMDSANTTIPGPLNLNPLHTAAPAVSVAYNSFFAMAVGNISTCNSAYDRWTIDQTKTITNDTPAL